MKGIEKIEKEIFVMKLKEMTFPSIARLVLYVNEHKLSSEQVVTIVPQKEQFILIFWDLSSYIPPLMESESTSIEKNELGIPQREEEILMPVTPDELAEVNIMYSQSRLATQELGNPPEKIVDYIKRKDLEREKTEKIKRAAEEFSKGQEKDSLD